MKYQLGDKIIVLHSNEEGEIVDIINDKMVLVDVRGVKFPAYMDQIDFPYFKRFSEKKIVAPKKEKKYIDNIKQEKNSPAKKIAGGVWLTFLPVMDTDEFGDDVVKELKLHLLNGTDRGYNFIYKQVFFGEIEFELKNVIHSGEDFYLHDVLFEDMNDNPSFDFEFTLVKPDKTKENFYEASLKLKAKQIFSKVEEIQKKNEATFSYRLFEKYPDKAYEEKIDTSHLTAKGYKIYDAKNVRQHLPPARSVVDLHIEKISDDWKRLSNFEIVTLQLKEFEKYYDLAVAHHLPSVIIIHGVGEGKLRDEIHDLLRLKREVKSFVNQYHPAYGYGATEIFFK
ncbi:MAG: Smr/MutS family protein [Bacteroidetes bacterium]|nr:Smr/MutS family protein [Bacteroidota bacterium]